MGYDSLMQTLSGSLKAGQLRAAGSKEQLSQQATTSTCDARTAVWNACADSMYLYPRLQIFQQEFVSAHVDGILDHSKQA